MKIARVFPRKTKASPTDDLAFFDAPGMFLPEIDAVHISTCFTYDLPKAHRLAEEWRYVGVPVSMGGPAMDDPGGEFVPVRYVKPGYVFTSRGCPGHCWFCVVPKREGGIMELPVAEGNNILDSNLLACSQGHILGVFQMLASQKYGRPMFTGGLEAARLKDWHVGNLRDLHPKEMFFAYDTADDYEPLVVAGIMLRAAGFTVTSHSMRCYVLIGYPGDTFEAAEARLQQTIWAGFLPMGMLYRDFQGKRDPQWAKFQRFWARPATVNLKMREMAI